MTELWRRLLSLRDEDYRRFNLRLIPNIQPGRMIGVRTPELRRIAKELARSPEVSAFLACLPHEYYEEDNIHGFIIEGFADFNDTIAALDKFLPYIDNWATCDLISPRCFAAHREELRGHIRRWLASDRTYTIRFALDMMIKHCLGESFDPGLLDLAAQLRSDEYYVRMAAAWYFSAALVSQYDAVLPYFTDYRLDGWTHNKAIQKAIESRRIGDETKAYLRTLKVRE